jgi:hypothetical protein
MFKTLNILKFVSSTEGGGESKVLLNLYRSLIRSNLDYGCIVYWSARPSYINLPDTVHHHSSRVTTLTWECSERLQLRVCMLKQTSLPLKTDVSNLVCRTDLLFTTIHNVSFIGGGNWIVRRKSLICRKSLTNLIT